MWQCVCESMASVGHLLERLPEISDRACDARGCWEPEELFMPPRRDLVTPLILASFALSFLLLRRPKMVRK